MKYKCPHKVVKMRAVLSGSPKRPKLIHMPCCTRCGVQVLKGALVSEVGSVTLIDKVEVPK